MSLQYLKKEVRDEVDLLHVDEHQVSYKLISTHWVSKFPTRWYYHLGMIKHSQYTKSNKFPISLQYLNKEVRNGVYFLHAEKYHAVSTSWNYLFDGSGYSTKSRKFTIYWEKRIAVAFVFYCDEKHSDILWGFSYVYCYVSPCTTNRL